MVQCFSHGTSLDTAGTQKFQKCLSPPHSVGYLPSRRLVAWGLGLELSEAGKVPERITPQASSLKPQAQDGGWNYRLNSALCEFTTLPSLVKVQE